MAVNSPNFLLTIIALRLLHYLLDCHHSLINMLQKGYKNVALYLKQYVIYRNSRIRQETVFTTGTPILSLTLVILKIKPLSLSGNIYILTVSSTIIFKWSVILRSASLKTFLVDCLTLAQILLYEIGSDTIVYIPQNLLEHIF